MVMGLIPLSSWDEYQNQLKKAGVDELIKIQNAAYQRYLEFKKNYIKQYNK